MRTSIAILSALVATVAAGTTYTTVDVTITSCPPEVTSCPGEEVYHPETVYSTVDVTITSCPPGIDYCPGESTATATYPMATDSVSDSVPTAYETPVNPSEDTPTPSSAYEITPSTTPSTAAEPSSVSSSTHEVEAVSSEFSGPATSVAPYPTWIVTVVTSSMAPVGTGVGTGVVRPSNATSTSPPIATFTGAASSLSASCGAFVGLAAIAAFFLA